MEAPRRTHKGNQPMSILRIDDSDLGYDQQGERASQAPVWRPQGNHEEEPVNPGESRADAGGTSYHVIFPIAVGAVFLAALVLGAVLG